jgi:hypothetical protein
VGDMNNISSWSVIIFILQTASSSRSPLSHHFDRPFLALFIFVYIPFQVI